MVRSCHAVLGAIDSMLQSLTCVRNFAKLVPEAVAWGPEPPPGEVDTPGSITKGLVTFDYEFESSNLARVLRSMCELRPDSSASQIGLTVRSASASLGSPIEMLATAVVTKVPR